MAFIDWTDDLSVGVARFDEEHRHLVDYINELHDAMDEGHGQDALRTILDGLVDYTRTHFANEEAFLLEHDYDQLDDQKLEHAELTRKVMELQRRFHDGASEVLSQMTLFFLKNWLIDHIQGKDKRYGEQFAAAAAD